MNAPARLPDGYAWATGLDDAHALLTDAIVPLLATGDRERDERIATVLARYGPAAGPLPRAARACARVVSTGDDPRLGRLAATALGRPHHHYPTLTQALADPGPAGGSVLLTADAAHLTLADLLPAHDTWTRRGTRLGLLTGRDAPAAVFLLAKILAAPSTPDGVSALIDGTTGRSRHLHRPGAPRITTADAITTPWRTLLIDAHGSAAHAHLGTAVLCGLPGDAERTTRTGHLVPGGCTPGRCKTSPSSGTTVHHPHDLHADILGLYICNAICLGPDEQYPTTVNLALDAVDGHPAAVFGLVRGDADTTAEDPHAAADLLHTGADLGTVTMDANRRAAERGLTGGAAILLGDPDHHPHPVHSDRPAPPAPRTSHPRPPAAPTPEQDRALADWTQRTTEAALFEAALGDSLAHRSDPGLDQCLRSMGEARSSAQTLLRRAAPTRGLNQEELERLAGQWAEQALALLTRTRGGAFGRQLTALRATHRTLHTTPAPPCPHCAMPLTAEHLTSVLGPCDRIAVTCPRCGPAHSHPAGQPLLTVHAPAAVHPGQPFTLTLDGPERGLLAVHLRPRSSRSGSYAHTTTDLAQGPLSIDLDVPTDLVPELDRLWLVHADRFRLALHQRRVPVLPAGCNPDRSTRAS
ncbi:hypothetical protein [Streptomyces sp. CBMA123]|uniref:hypothetical protein n=1 Tax=Streptomyces sp. CBMA123 TaxID=1896313 RepID=UPI001661997B|nr:hypothetical protein [Streptomyces sp. CBMA123]MBD0692482.1 hypothetical protein [Streptomyces sp. CBMA123]